MSSGWIVVRGEAHITLEAAAACYAVRVEWVREVYALGLLGTGEPIRAPDPDADVDRETIALASSARASNGCSSFPRRPRAAAPGRRLSPARPDGRARRPARPCRTGAARRPHAGRRAQRLDATGEQPAARPREGGGPNRACPA